MTKLRQITLVKSNLKPADAKARALYDKLQALAERGVDGERLAAQHKLARLKARFDFTGGSCETPDLFSGRFSRSERAIAIFRFGVNELDLASSVKWAIEAGTHITCLFRNDVLMAEAKPQTAKRLAEIAAQITGSFRALIKQFGAVEGVNEKDRNVFVMGLYDGMMNETREVGQPLPGRAESRKRQKLRRDQVKTHGLNIHPYSIGVSLGKQIRFSASVEEISAELDVITRKHLS